MHPDDANALVDELTGQVDEYDKAHDEARKLTQMLIQGTSGQKLLKWVEVLGHEIMERAQGRRIESVSNDL